MKAVEVMVRELAESDVPVLISGEPGVGKCVIARRIHELSPRRSQALGMFSPGPQAGPVGRFDNLRAVGTAFLRNVEQLSSDEQAELLDSLSSNGEATSNGHFGPRLISATCSDLEAEVRAGKFREDLYYRISSVSLRLPPLRQRKDDIRPLTDFFLAKYAQEFRRSAPALSSETQQLFHDYAWPGNLRELEDATKALVLLGDENLAMGGLRAVLAKTDRAAGDERVSLKQASRAASREAEKQLILKVLNKTRWNRRRAAQELQISYKALLYKLKQIGYGEYETT
jgi:DNA-binding NtrC family response regulator